MLINRIIINSSPLIVLFKSQKSELLPQLFTEILVPEGVFEEVTQGRAEDMASRQLSTVPWIKRVIIDSMAPEVAAWDLGKGESQVLSLALKHSDYAAIVDDRAARRCGQSLNIITMGTGGLLILAKKRGLISSISPGIEALLNAGLWLSDNMIKILKQQAGE
ncbi:DUF3368 domain-containing protein [Dolichospermum flos-aquae]|uniref:DUF3368 domain-containing protein n=1 Tax=Dolichospermum flos-aquae CCAP 1403/13F TaxID=315271 RepID=A0A6H2C0X0_DOLFA|nr:DUF3368 domain-containing protein [Dolichospermum flos-aquae]QJB45472.1 DUF3368 domain-containing protein [Dolichospermum flos-aquae CCAP 1403/13F]